MTARISRPSSTIMLFKSKRLKDNSCPVVLRVTFGGKRKYYTIGQALESDWSGSRYKKQKEKNIKLAAIEHKASKIISDLADLEMPFTFDRFEKEMFVESNLKKVLAFIDQEIESLTALDRAGSLSATKTLFNHLHKYRKGKDLTFPDLDRAFLENFEKYLRKTCSTNGVAVYMRQLKAIYNKAISLRLVKRDYYPFLDYKIKTETTRKRALTKEQVSAIINHPAEEGTRLFHSRNIFAFSYMCRGMNFIDIAKLAEENLINNRIQYIRTKTKTARSKEGKVFSIPIRGLIREILNYYRKNHFTGSGYIFPILTKRYASQRAQRWAIQKKLAAVNEDLKQIASDLKFPDPESITTYTARHSWATLTRKHGARTEFIQEGLGHGNIKTTETYLSQFENEELDKADEYLEEEFTSLKINRSAS